MKRKLALFLALVMILSLVPANVFATSDNSVNKVPSVTDSKEFIVGESDTPLLTIKEDALGEFGREETFRLELTNGDWSDTAEADLNTPANITNEFDNATATVEFNQLSDTRMEVKITTDVDTDTTVGYIKIPMLVVVDDEGDVKVTVNGMDSAVSDGTYTFAKASGGDTATSVDSTVDFADGDIVTIEDIFIDELTIGTITSGAVIELKLMDGDFSWDEDTMPTITFGGGLEDQNGSAGALDIEDRILEFTVSLDADTTARGSITIAGLRVDADKDAKIGEVEVKIYGDDVTEETFVVAEYLDYAVTIEADDAADDLPLIYAGTKTETVSIINIEELVLNGLIEDRSFELTFPDYVQILEVDLDGMDGLDFITGDEDSWYATGDNVIEIDDIERDGTEDNAGIYLEVTVSVEADAPAGDLVVVATGKALAGETFEATVAEIAAPITVEVEVADVKVGLQDQLVGKIVVTEAEEGILEKDEEITFTLDDNYFKFAGTPDIEVTKGDIEVSIDVDDQLITITIDEDSTDVSTFEITGVLVDLDRSVPEGDFLLGVGGSAIVFNNDTDNFDEDFDTDYVVEEAYIRVITPTDYDVKTQEDVVFTIDAMTYMVGETVVNMDAAPFIDASNRTMLPLRAFANALNVMDTDILWNGVERSVTIFKGDRVVKVIIGQMSFMINGVNVPMDTQAIIKDSRTFLPVRALGQALGAEITWDAATRSVTIK